MPRTLTKRSDSEWEDIFRRCKASGKSDARWCHENGISTSSFYRHFRIFRNVQILSCDSNAVIPVKHKTIEEDIHEIVPLTIADEQELPLGNETYDSGTATVAAAKIHLGGITIDLYNGVSEATVGSILNAASKLC